LIEGGFDLREIACMRLFRKEKVTMTNERWLRWAIARHFRQKGFEVNMKPVKVGNASIDGEVAGEHWKMALEIKSGHDDVVRGLGQLSAARWMKLRRHANSLQIEPALRRQAWHLYPSLLTPILSVSALTDIPNEPLMFNLPEAHSKHSLS
jgi:hypothetical protein